ncbi:unnamed protein product, partial [Phaeothamnion confervicola]
VDHLDPSGSIAEAAFRAGSLSRRALLVTAVGGGASLALAPLGASGKGARAQDTAILNFALTLEYLQAAFYSEAERRKALTGDNAGAAKLIGAIERAHVAALVGLLGRDAGPSPFFDFQGTTEDDDKFVKTSVGFEDFSAAAYQGALTQLNAPALVSGAASIHTVEARHAAWLRFLQGLQPATRGLDDPIDAVEATRLVKSTGFIRPRARTETSSAPPFAG